MLLPSSVRTLSGPYLGLLMLIVSITSTQAGTAAAKFLVVQVGPEVTVALRLACATMLLFIAVRPWRHVPSGREWKSVLIYGVAIAFMNGCFYQALARIPQGMAVAVEFSGPLMVAVCSSRRWTDVAGIVFAVAGLLLNSALVVALVLGAARWYRGRKPDAAAPRGVVGLFETLVESLVDDLIEPCVGPSYRRFAPYLLTVFCLNNLMGLIPFFPGGANVTGNIAVALVLAVATFLVVNLSGSRHYWKDIFWPDVPTWLKVPVPIIPLIELVGVFTKPFALMIRLFANMLAGHAVILSLTCVVFVTVKMGAAVNASMTALSVLFSIFMNCLELLVAFLQAYVFTMLSAVFIGLAQERGGEADAGAEK